METTPAQRGAATAHVIRNLQKDSDHFTPVGTTFSMDSQESFTADAKRYLGDRTGLSTRTIDRADYAAAYEYFSIELEKITDRSACEGCGWQKSNCICH